MEFHTLTLLECLVDIEIFQVDIMHVNILPFILFRTEMWLFERGHKNISPEKLNSVFNPFHRQIGLVFFVVVFYFTGFFIKVLPHNFSRFLFFILSMMPFLSLNHSQFLFFHRGLLLDKIQNITRFIPDHLCEVQDPMFSYWFLFGIILDREHFPNYCLFKYFDRFHRKPDLLKPIIDHSLLKIIDIYLTHISSTLISRLSSYWYSDHDITSSWYA